jgi:hypothetical protein
MVIEQNHCYLITTSSLVNYNNAQTACQTLQADLCKVSTDAEYQALLIYTSGIAAYNNFWVFIAFYFFLTRVSLINILPIYLIEDWCKIS